MRRSVFNILLLVSILCTSCLKQKEDNGPGGSGTPPVQRDFDWSAIADSAQGALNNYFWNAGGKFFAPVMNSGAFNHNYWPNAHGLDVLIDAYLRKAKDPVIKQQMDDLVAGLKAANNNTYINYYYDDMEWLLISSLRAFKETNDNRYKDIADVVWTDVKDGWDNIAGGGFYWRKDRANKNTPANAPACIFAARLYQITDNADDLAWAKKIYAWISTHLIQANGDVWDGTSSFDPLSYDTRAYTYNYGTVIGSSLELFKITNDPQYKNDAVKVASAALTKLSRDGILVPGDSGDGGLFNGIFVRYLVRLIVEGGLDNSTKSSFISFLEKNATTMWTKGTYFPNCLIGPDWKVSASSTTLTPQLSGVILLEGMAELKKLGLVQ